jgi:flagellar biosynthesis/type III secretory pathway protein FliH
MQQSLQQVPNLEEVVSVANVLANDLVRRRDEVARQQLDKLVLHVLNEIEASKTVTLDYKHGEVAGK